MDYKLIDSDNHYDEAEDAFTRHGDDEVNRSVEKAIFFPTLGFGIEGSIRTGSR